MTTYDNDDRKAQKYYIQILYSDFFPCRFHLKTFGNNQIS